jgi:hypothetical protein
MERFVADRPGVDGAVVLFTEGASSASKRLGVPTVMSGRTSDAGGLF